jgi:hypothetical protein
VANEVSEVMVVRWADEWVPTSKPPPARLNYALDRSFTVQPFYATGIPKGDFNVTYNETDAGG